MKFDFSVDTNNVLKDLSAFGEAVEKAANKEFLRYATSIQSEAIRRIQQAPASGTIYKRGTITHQASAAGEYPKTDTGNLVASIKSQGLINDGKNQSGLDVYLVGSPLVYAAYLEFGTLNMSARPWLYPTALSLKKKFEDNLNQAIKRAINAT